MWYGMIQEQVIVDKKNTLANYFFHQLRQMTVFDKNGTIIYISKVRFSSGIKSTHYFFQSDQ
jgi:hypothetical protein